MNHRDTLGNAFHKTFLMFCSVLLLNGSLTGCSWMPFFGDKEETDIEEIETNEEKVYAQAQRSLRSSNYNSAIDQLELLEAHFPFGRFAEQAQLELIYARYMTFDLEGARSGADRFIRLHPGHDNVDYAYYLRACLRTETAVICLMCCFQPTKQPATWHPCARPMPTSLYFSAASRKANTPQMRNSAWCTAQRSCPL